MTTTYTHDHSATITIINPTHRMQHDDKRYVLWFGACAPTYLMVYAGNLEGALEECADYLAEHLPGLIDAHGCEALDDLMREVCEERGLEWPAPEDARMQPYWDAEQDAFSDLTYTESGYITSCEWGIALECPDRTELLVFATVVAGWRDVRIVAAL